MPGTNIHSTKTSLPNYVPLVSDSKSKAGAQCDEIEKNKTGSICSLRKGKRWSRHTKEATKPVCFLAPNCKKQQAVFDYTVNINS